MKRRALLKTGALAVTASLPIFRSYANVLKNDPIEHATGGHIKFRLGGLELLVVTDGHILISPAQPIIAPGIAKEKVKAAMADNFMPSGMVDAAINILVIRKEKKILLSTQEVGQQLGIKRENF